MAKNLKSLKNKKKEVSWIAKKERCNIWRNEWNMEILYHGDLNPNFCLTLKNYLYTFTIFTVICWIDIIWTNWIYLNSIKSQGSNPNFEILQYEINFCFFDFLFFYTFNFTKKYYFPKFFSTSQKNRELNIETIAVVPYHNYCFHVLFT